MTEANLCLTGTRLQENQTRLISSALSVGALKFGSFQLKFLPRHLQNDGMLCDITMTRLGCFQILPPLFGSMSPISSLTSVTLLCSGIPHFDVFFRPAYNGIPHLTASVALFLCCSLA